MSVARVTEITAASTKSFEDAVQIGMERANKTLKNVRGAWIRDQKVPTSIRSSMARPRKNGSDGSTIRST